VEFREIGEFGFIARRRSRMSAFSPDVFKGIGDDAAITSLSTGTDLVSAVDFFFQEVHCGLTLTSARYLGRKSFAVNLSDIAIIDGGNSDLGVHQGEGVVFSSAGTLAEGCR
jgi:thiamine-monophosphate kinase